MAQVAGPVPAARKTGDWTSGGGWLESCAAVVAALTRENVLGAALALFTVAGVRGHDSS
jgi:hypothetical protein